MIYNVFQAVHRIIISKLLNLLLILPIRLGHMRTPSLLIVMGAMWYIIGDLIKQEYAICATIIAYHVLAPIKINAQSVKDTTTSKFNILVVIIISVKKDVYLEHIMEPPEENT